MTRIETIPVSALPGMPRLFVDFQEHFERVRPFYSDCSSGVELISGCVEQVLQQSYRREDLAAALERQNKRWEAPPEVGDSIRRLRDPRSVAVVTGQQIGIGGGPALALYKTVTALQATARLLGEGIPAVAVFWMASEDHDFEEIRQIDFPDPTGQPVAIRYGGEAEQSGSVGSLAVEEAGIAEIVQTLRRLWPDAQEILQLFEDSYRAGQSLADGFARFWLGLFGRHGLVVIDPAGDEVKPLQVDLFRKVLHERRQVRSAMERRNDELRAARYPLQVSLTEGHTLLLVTHEDRRLALIAERDGFRLGDSELRWTEQQTLEMLDSQPGRFSANVLLRPLLQDSIFPTATYIGGPAEIAYYAQLQPLFPLFGEREAIIRPRLSLTVVDARSQRLLERFQVTLQNLFEQGEDLVENALRSDASGPTLAEFDSVERMIADRLESLGKVLEQTDPTLGEALRTSESKMRYQLERVRAKYLKSAEQRNATVGDQIRYLRNVLVPDGRLQERTIHSLYFLCRLGQPWLDHLIGETNLDSRAHQALYL